ncbi:hypothetical protein HK405_001653, partial [Cladochytrium tenue]
NDDHVRGAVRGGGGGGGGNSSEDSAGAADGSGDSTDGDADYAHLARPPEACKAVAGEYVAAIVDWVESALPFWNRTGGADHVFVFSWDQASEVLGWAHPVRARIRNAVHLTTLGSER